MKLFRLLGLLLVAAMLILPVGLALAWDTYPNRNLPDVVERGETFNVYVNFTSAGDDFRGISCRDTAPAGWNVTPINPAWSDPDADSVAPPGGTGPPNQASITWNGPYNSTQNFSARYKVTVPCDASLGYHSWNVSFPEGIFVGYHVGSGGQSYADNITGDDIVIEVIRPTMNFDPESMSIDFYGAVNGTNPQNQTMELWSSTPCMLNWNVTDDADYNGTDWLSESPENGSCTDVHSFITLSVNSSGMEAGNYFANITINSSDANNTPQIVNVTLHMSMTDVLKAHVNFVGRGSNNTQWIEPFDVWLFNPGTTHVVWAGNRTTNSTGWFNITDVPVGTYDIGIKNWTCLSEVVADVTVSEGVGGVVDFGITREGDANNDDWVTGADRSIHYAAWGSWQGSPGWDANCDFNRDGWLTGADRSMMYTYWGQKGDLVP